MNQASHTFAGWGTRCFKFATLAVAALAFAAPEIASAQTWCTILEQSPNAAVVPDATVRAKIVASGYPWRVRDTGTGIELLLIPGGTFTMGCSAPNGYSCDLDENPNHQVTLSKEFYLGKTEVTQAQWQAKMGNNPSYFSGNANNPVEQVSWNDIAGFNTATGLRLPSEAEWEYACRGGTTTAFHSMPGFPNGTNDASLLGNIAWYSSNSGWTTHAVAGNAANAFGMYDMSGNACEWCNDWFGDYSASNATDPTGPSFGQYGAYRVLRGGDWNVQSFYCRSSYRRNVDPANRPNGVGFRVARTPAASDFPDTDGDGIPDFRDNCVNIANPSQADCDNDGIGDACELAATASPYPAAVQWTVASGGNGHWYTAIHNAVDWSNAKSLCKSVGGHLATITSQGEANFVSTLLGNVNKYWLGGFQPDGSTEPSSNWQWVTGEPWIYTNWRTAEPNNAGGNEKFLEIQYPPSSGWNDFSDSTNWYVCEWSKNVEIDCNNNSIPDSCDIASGALDINTDGILDTCQGLSEIDTTTSSLGIPTANIAVSTTFTGLTTPLTDATLIIQAKGDFDGGLSGYEFLTLKINDITLQRLFETSGVNCSSATNGGVSSATITIPLATFAQYAATGTMKVTLLPAPSVTAGECSNEFMTVELKYVSMNASGDCDNDAQWDAVEISASPTLDSNTNGKLDFCEFRDDPTLDRNNNGLFDSSEIAADPTLDLDLNGVLDSWQIAQNPALDCDNNGKLDTGEIAKTPTLDCNANGRLDKCDIVDNPTLDCDSNGKLDTCEIQTSPTLDCNANGRLDKCDIVDNPTLDCDSNGKLDTCEIVSTNSGNFALTWGGAAGISMRIPTTQSGITAIAGSSVTSIAIKNGSVLVWGSNSNGLCLGTDATGNPITGWTTGVPVQIMGQPLTGVTAIASGVLHSIALKDGAVFAWGSGLISPIPVHGGSYVDEWGQSIVPDTAKFGVIAIAGGWVHTIALKNNGAVLAWGAGATTTEPTPGYANYNCGQSMVPSNASFGVKAIAGGGGFTLALKSDSSVLAWGENLNGQCLGTNTSGSPIISSIADGTVPVQINGITLTGVTAIAGGGNHAIALKDGAVLAWGDNHYRQCNIPVAAQSGVSAIAGGADHTIALKAGAVLAWGAGTTRQTNGGSGNNEYGQSIVPASANSGVTAIAGGSYHTIALHTPVDTNNNNRLDSCEIADNAALDRNNNGMLDSYDCAQNPALDCNRNSSIDDFDLLDHPEWDCNFNLRIDTCDFEEGASDDDMDGHLDICEFAKCDLDLSGVIDSGDFSILLLYYGEENTPFGDFDGSGMIDAGDAAVMLLYFGPVTWP